MNEKPRVVIYTSIQSERLNFVLDTIFHDKLKIPYLQTHDLGSISPNDVVIEYNTEKSATYDFIQAHPIIHQNGIDAEFIPLVQGEGENLQLFPSDNSLFGMDIFAAVFYCLSHYDAYKQKHNDEHSRIIFSKWFPRTSGLDKLPYVEIWLHRLSLYLTEKGFSCHQNIFEQDISFDIDHFYVLDQRPIWKHIRASIADIFRFKFFQLFQRWLIILGLKEDPGERFFDLLDYQYVSNLTFFILMKHGGKNSLNPLNDLKRALIIKLKQYGKIGIHPSYHVSEKRDMLSEEIHTLNAIVKEPIVESRFHFLRVQFPQSYYDLHQSSIQIDKSIGYYDRPGFPSATSMPYSFFDPLDNRRLPIIIEPFVWMDSMNKYYREILAEDEKEELYSLKNIVQKYNGKFSVVFHNDSMIDRRYRVLFKSLMYN